MELDPLAELVEAHRIITAAFDSLRALYPLAEPVEARYLTLPFDSLRALYPLA